jgi:hypothetical protein
MRFKTLKSGVYEGDELLINSDKRGKIFQIEKVDRTIEEPNE